MPSDLEGKTILLTGATGWLGSEMYHGLTERGAVIIGMGNSKSCDYKVDFYDTETLRDVLKDIVSLYPIDVLINNAWDLSAIDGWGETKEDWMKAFECFYWNVVTTEVVGSYFEACESGKIINITSMYSRMSPDFAMYEGTRFSNCDSYGATKASLTNYTKRTAAKLADYGVTCNSIAPGSFPDIVNKVKDTKFLLKLGNKTLLKRYGEPKDLVGMVAFLCSDDSDYITGKEFEVDGGWTNV